MAKGINPGPIDGIYGGKTENAIRDYQRKNNLNETGKPSDDLISKLREVTQGITDRESQFNELRVNVNGLQASLNRSERARGFLSKQLAKMRKDFQRGESFQEQKYDLINIGSDLITDTVTITLAILAFGLLGTYALIRYKVEEDVKTMLKAAEARIFYGVALKLSHAFYLYYRTFLEKEETRKHRGFSSGIDLATWFSGEAVKYAMILSDHDRLKFAESHKAYHYASKSLVVGDNEQLQDHQNQDAMHIASQLNEFAKKLRKDGRKQWIDCKESLAWIFILLGDEEQKRKGRNIAKSLVERDELPPPLAKELKENYKRVGEKLWD